MLNVDDWKGTLRHAQFRAAACRSRTIKMSLCFYQTLILFFNRLECIHSTNEPHLVALCIGSPCVVVYFSDFIGWNRWRSSCDPARKGGDATHADENWLKILCKSRQHCNCTNGLVVCRGRGISLHGFLRVCRGLSVYIMFILWLSGAKPEDRFLCEEFCCHGPVTEINAHVALQHGLDTPTPEPGHNNRNTLDIWLYSTFSSTKLARHSVRV